MTETVLPEWATHALNGNSTRVPRHWTIEELKPGDLLAGKVVQRGRSTLDVQVEVGTLAGEPLEPGEWRRVSLAGVGILRAWVKRDEPDVGDNVVIKYLGRVGGGARPKLDFACGVSRPAPWEG
jgi:hypothetical protein